MTKDHTSQFVSIALTLFFLATIPSLAQTSTRIGFLFVTNNGSITITYCGASNLAGDSGEVDVPESTNGYPVTGISSNAFGDTYVTSVRFPASITNIDEGAFKLPSMLTNIVVDANNPNYTSVGGVLFNKSMTLLLAYPTGLADYTYTNYSVPNGVNRIGAWAFDGCFDLSSVTIPNSVSSFGAGAFFYCRSLTNVVIPDGVTNIEGDTFMLSGLTSVIIPGTVASIGTNAFQSCYSLTKVSLTNGITSIGWAAFGFCPISNIVIPSSVTNFSGFVFAGCPNLTNIYFMGAAPTVEPTTFDDTQQAYHLPGAIGWDDTLAGIPTAVWLPTIQVASDLAKSNPVKFNVNWASGQTVVVEASSNLFNENWQALETNVLTTGSIYFSDTQWTNYPNRFYRIRSQ